MKAYQLYYKYPTMKDFKARVISCRARDGMYEVQLESTIFYPEGGGQPADTGTIGEARVAHVYSAADGIIHCCDSPLEVGEEYDAAIDWDKRFDHMQHHTAEHLVSGIINKLYGADNVGFSIGEQYVTIDFNRELSREDADNIENLANEAVFKNLPVKIEYFDTTPDFSYRSKKELSGTIRIVRIDDYDICACAGTQLASTGEIGLIKITSVQKYKGGSRIYLLCGHRALNDYRVKEHNVAAISALLSSKPYEVAEHVERLYAERETLKFELLSAKYAIIDTKTEKMAPSDKILIFEDDLSSEEMKHYITNLSEKISTIAVFTGDDTDGYRYLVTSRTADVSELAKTMNTELNGKGGGKGTAGGYVNAQKPQIEEFFRAY